jgi:hypothetical protein
MAGTSEIDDLFQLPLDQFTAARNALAATLKKKGRADEADRVKALAKPPVSAWTVNQLHWRHRKAFDRLMEACERFRKAQAAQLAGKAADLRAPLEARRAALSELTKLAADVLRDAGHNASPEMMRRITTTLEALATYGAGTDGPTAGRLSDDVDPPGFEALAALVPSRRGGRTGDDAGRRVIPFKRAPAPALPTKKATGEEALREREQERKRQVAAAKSAVHDADRTLKAARKAAEQAEAALKKAAARAKEAETVKKELEQRLEKAAAESDQARQDARRIASEAESAAQEVEDAERALEKAQHELDELA